MGGQCSIIPNQEPDYQLLIMPSLNNKQQQQQQQPQHPQFPQQQPIPIYGYSGYPIIQGYYPMPFGYNQMMMNPFNNPLQQQQMLKQQPYIYQQMSKEFCSPEMYESMLKMMMLEKQRQKQNNGSNIHSTVLKSKSKSKSKSKYKWSKSNNKSNKSNKSSKSKKFSFNNNNNTLSNTFSLNKHRHQYQQQEKHYLFDTENVRNQTAKQLEMKLQQILNNDLQQQQQQQQQDRIKKYRKQRKNFQSTAANNKFIEFNISDDIIDEKLQIKINKLPAAAAAAAAKIPAPNVATPIKSPIKVVIRINDKNSDKDIDKMKSLPICNGYSMVNKLPIINGYTFINDNKQPVTTPKTIIIKKFINNFKNNHHLDFYSSTSSS